MRPMTLRGWRVIHEEIGRLWHEERPEVVREVSAAAELGDRSENAAYIYGKKRLRNIDSRLRYLRKKIDGVKVVDVAQIVPTDHVRFGAIVVVENSKGETRIWRLVDREESEPSQGRISVQSPIGQALMGKEEGDDVSVRTPKGIQEYEVIEVRYGADGP